MTRSAKVLVLLGISAFIAANERRVLSHTHWGRRETVMREPAAPRRGTDDKVAMDSPFGAIPPPGTSSACDWKGVDTGGRPVLMTALNCYESVNYLTSGEPGDFLYRTWPGETLSALDDPATWDRLENSLRVGDVVEFMAHWRASNGSMEASTFHTQLCVGPNGLMGAANNEARFDVINGMPTYTQRWALCTTRQYYAAARSMDQAWTAFGRPMTYSIRVYRRPWWNGKIAAALGENLELRAGLLPRPTLQLIVQRSGSGIVPRGRG